MDGREGTRENSKMVCQWSEVKLREGGKLYDPGTCYLSSFRSPRSTGLLDRQSAGGME